MGLHFNSPKVIGKYDKQKIDFLKIDRVSDIIP